MKTLPLEVLQELIVQCPNSTCAETCLMSLDLSHIELGAIERFCVAHGLYGAFIAAYNVKLPTALSAPLDALLRLVEEDESVWDACSSVLLLYLSLSLRGRSFPAAAELPPAACVQARLQLLSRLFFEPRTGADAAARFLEAFANRFLDGTNSALGTTRTSPPLLCASAGQRLRERRLDDEGRGTTTITTIAATAAEFFVVIACVHRPIYDGDRARRASGVG